MIGWGTGGPLYADEIAASRRQSTIRLALQEIADAQGDVDAFIAQQSETAKTVQSGLSLSQIGSLPPPRFVEAHP